MTSIACRTPTSCALAGDYTTSHDTLSAFVAVEADGRFTGAEPVPGTWAWSRWYLAETSAVACGAVGHCVVGGAAADDRRPSNGGFGEQAFLATYGPLPRVRSLSAASGPRRGGTRLVIYGSGFVGPVTVRFGKDPARVLAVLDRGAIEVLTPRGRGMETASVTTAMGTSSGGGGTHFTFPVACRPPPRRPLAAGCSGGVA